MGFHWTDAKKKRKNHISKTRKQSDTFYVQYRLSIQREEKYPEVLFL